MHHANEKRREEKKCPRAGVYSDKGRLPGSTFFPAREELVGVLLSENPSIHYDIYIYIDIPVHTKHTQSIMVHRCIIYTTFTKKDS